MRNFLYPLDAGISSFKEIEYFYGFADFRGNVREVLSVLRHVYSLRPFAAIATLTAIPANPRAGFQAPQSSCFYRRHGTSTHAHVWLSHVRLDQKLRPFPATLSRAQSVAVTPTCLAVCVWTA